MTCAADPEPAAAGAVPSPNSSSFAPGSARALLVSGSPADGPLASGGRAPGMRDGPGRPGHQVVLGLFVVLAVCVLIVFTVFALAVRPEDREWVPELMARYLYMPVVATGVLVAIDAYGRGHRRWWLFLLTAPVPLVNIALAAAWLLRWRPRPPTWLTGS